MREAVGPAGGEESWWVRCRQAKIWEAGLRVM